MNNRWTPTDRRNVPPGQPDYRADTGWREYDQQQREPAYAEPYHDGYQTYGQPREQQYDDHYGVAEHESYGDPVHGEPAYDYEPAYDPTPAYGHDQRGYRHDLSHEAPHYENERYDHQRNDHQRYDRDRYEPERFDNAQYEPEPPAAAPAAIPPRGRAHSRRQANARKKRGRSVIALAAVIALIFGVAVVYAAVRYFDKPEVAADYTGTGGDDVVIQVKDGDTADQIATELAGKDVVASAAAFYEAAVQNTAMNNVQPGFYALPSKSPASKAVAALTDPKARVGAVVLSEGRQLHDSKDVKTGAVKEGIYRKIASASCIGEDGAQKCVSYDDLNNAGASTDLDSLGVPAWAADNVRKVPDRDRQLEGLIAAGSLNFDPTLSAKDILKQLVTDSTTRYEQTGILNPDTSDGNLSPYQKLTAASLVERESLPQDFGKVARVIINRLAVKQPLQFDSTVNYALDTTEVATTDADREKVTPWNTYASPGLPATPISAPSIDALKAIEAPTPGNFLYFVTIDNEGTTLFTDNYDEHLRNIERAGDSGILQSGR